MRSKTTVLVLFLAALSAPSLLAQTCPMAPTYYSLGGGLYWYDYTPDPACVTTNSRVSPTTLWCYEKEGWSASSLGYVGLMTYTFTANPSINTWYADVFLEFNDPNNSSYNFVELYAGVDHNGVTTWTQLMQHDGTDGDISCQRLGDYFEAVEGDEITIEIYTRRYHSDATIEVSVPTIQTANY